MPDPHDQPHLLSAADAAPPSIGIYNDDGDGGELRLLSRSPHPYHRQRSELLHPSDRLSARTSGARRPNRRSDDGDALHPSAAARPATAAGSNNNKDSTTTSDSGTDADDEHFLKGLPAPRTRWHKGLRGRNEPVSGTSTPLLSPALLEEEGRKGSQSPKQDPSLRERRANAERTRRKREIFRRVTEFLVLFSLGAILYSNRDVKPFVHAWSREFITQSVLAAILVAIYPLRVVLWAYAQGSPSKQLPLAIPASFDPAPLFYPTTIPLYVSLLLAPMNKFVVLPNLVLSISAMPKPLIPFAESSELCAPVHWLISTVPMIVSGLKAHEWGLGRLEAATIRETAVLLYPLHQNLCMLLHQLTTTSLLPAELQMLSIALINILLLSTSPQMVILKALLWGGGLALLVMCGHVIRWGITLARVPKWRFRRVPPGSRRPTFFRWLSSLLPTRRFRYRSAAADQSDSESCALSDMDDQLHPHHGRSSLDAIRDGPLIDGAPVSLTEILSVPSEEEARELRFTAQSTDAQGGIDFTPVRRHTLPSVSAANSRSKTHTPSGRRKRSASSSIRAFFSLTQAQATARKWVYAVWVYICILGIILAGIRPYVERSALNGEEPIGWALGYLFGGLNWIRLQVEMANIERWICLPPRLDPEERDHHDAGWVEHIRHAILGEANTRLALSAYWICIIVVGLAVVFKLTPIYEVDTRRKVFHFMMVGMLLPATYVDPAYVALALVLVLAIFLLLDLIRASQLPPLSKPIASFLTPYVDGRDLRGPVVISHIFLLIGCSIPLWLSLAAIGRGGKGALQGWEVPTRDVSMVSGVVCVGLGDAAASLIGRRWGHRKWVWGGGKSLEGSVAFAVAVFVGLVSASAWLHIGGWPISGELPRLESAAAAGYAGACGLGGTGAVGTLWECASAWWRWHVSSAVSPLGATAAAQHLVSGLTRAARGAAVCGAMASLTEAVLTGGNDNVVVPVVLWTCVKSLGV
ncbi:hypothetical protein RB595_007484 [Gaeumannomyces hyphopodioides]